MSARKLLLVFSLSLLVFPAAAWAVSSSFSGSVTWGQPARVSVVTGADGLVTARALWAAKAKGRYSLTLRHLTRPDDIFSYDRHCQAYETLSGAYIVESVGGANGYYTPGDALCKFDNGPAGYWVAEFLNVSGGKTTVTVMLDGT